MRDQDKNDAVCRCLHLVDGDHVPTTFGEYLCHGRGCECEYPVPIDLEEMPNKLLEVVRARDELEEQVSRLKVQLNNERNESNVRIRELQEMLVKRVREAGEGIVTRPAQAPTGSLPALPPHLSQSDRPTAKPRRPL